MSQAAFAALLFSIGILIVGVVLSIQSPRDELVEQCKAHGGELVAVRVGAPLCIRRDALIALP